MRQTVPWQILVTVVMMLWASYGLLAIGAIVTTLLFWPNITAVLLITGFAVLTLIGPVHLSWNGRAFNVLVPAHLFHQAFFLVIFGFHYSHVGLTRSTGGLSYSFYDGLFFSLSAWTTLGASDLSVPVAVRWLPLIQAGTALLFLPIFGAVFWEMLNAMTDKEPYLQRLDERLEKERSAAVKPPAR